MSELQILITRISNLLGIGIVYNCSTSEKGQRVAV